jgi:molybdate transport system substrate-binding protein
MTKKQRTTLAALVALLAIAIVVLLGARGAHAEEARVAVASNFVGPMRKLSAEFTKRTGHTTVLVSGATGKLYVQIKNGAPFDVLLAADQKAPRQLESDGLAEAGTRFTYAIGKLVLFSTKPNLAQQGAAVLRAGSFEHLAIANPKLAPYGAAGMAVMTKLGVLDALTPKLVFGENIAQTLQFVESGNAELGFVAWSQIVEGSKPRAGSYWLVPDDLYPTISQDAVVLRKSAKNRAAIAFAEFLKSDVAQQLIREAGYAVPDRAKQ